MKEQHDLLKKAAISLGIQVEDLSEWGEPILVLKKGHKQHIIADGEYYDIMPASSEYIMKRKHLSKKLFDKLKIKTPRCITLKNWARQKKNIVKILKDNPNTEWVLKPSNGLEGLGVKLHLKKIEEIEIHYTHLNSEYDTCIFEEFIRGNDLRIQVNNGKILAACTRIPAEIIGDGIKNITNLTKSKNKKIKKFNPNNHIEIETETLKLLTQQGYTLKDIPENGTIIKLKELANMSQGARAVDVTDSLHENYHVWISKIVKFLKSPHFALDLITIDHSKDPNMHANAIEINAGPCWLHHTFSEVKKHDIASQIIKSLFKDS